MHVDLGLTRGQLFRGHRAWKSLPEGPELWHVYGDTSSVVRVQTDKQSSVRRMFGLGIQNHPKTLLCIPKEEVASGSPYAGRERIPG